MHMKINMKEIVLTPCCAFLVCYNANIFEETKAAAEEQMVIK